MSPARLIKHNPMFLSEAELKSAFVVRETELDLLLTVVKENTGPVNQHVMIIGARGMGKTMLVRRLALAINQDEELKSLWYPVVLPEEVYDVSGEGELWLRVLERIALQEKNAERDNHRWLKLYETLRLEKDRTKLRIQTLSALNEFSAERKVKILVVAENLQMVLGEQSGANAGWDLRKTLLNNPEIMLVTTATVRFSDITNAEKANFELFREIVLYPLSTDECRTLWHSVNGEEMADDRIRPMEILTGGSPRLLAVLADFATGRTLAELMDDLVILIDDHTTYFKANVEYLPPTERRVFVTLAEIWEPAEARQVAERCRLDVNTASAFLKKLIRRGSVAEVTKVGRKNLYQIVERLYNIYYLMRLSGAEADRVRALVRFMVPLYGEERIARALADEVCCHEGESRLSWLEGYKTMLSELARTEGGIERVLSAVPDKFLSLPEVADVNKMFPRKTAPASHQEIRASLSKQLSESVERRDWQSVLNCSDELLIEYKDIEEPVSKGIVALALSSKGLALQGLGRPDEAIVAYDEAISYFSGQSGLSLQKIILRTFINKGSALEMLSRMDEAVAIYNEAIKRFGNANEPTLQDLIVIAFVSKGRTLDKLDRTDEAVAAYDEAIRRFGEGKEQILKDIIIQILLIKGADLERLGRVDEAIDAYNELIRRFGNAEEPDKQELVALTLSVKANTLWLLGRMEEAIDVYDDFFRRSDKLKEPALQGRTAEAHNNKARIFLDEVRLFSKSKDPAAIDQAIHEVRTALLIAPQENQYRLTLACLFGLASRWEEAFAEVKNVLNDDRIVNSRSTDIIEFFIDAAAADQAEPSLQILKRTKIWDSMEPLIVALKMHIGKPYRAPREVVEVANDILQKIHNRSSVKKSV